MYAQLTEGIAGVDELPTVSADDVVRSVEHLMRERASEPLKSSHVPTRSMSRNEALDALEQTRAQLFRVLDAARTIDLSAIKQQHPVLGELDLYQFLVFVARHEDRHRAQITRLRAQLDAGRVASQP
jgi:uncharacterized damage-inducible protein DinB